jgi:Bacterial transcriptional activator domain
MGPVQVTAPGTIESNRVTVCTELITYMATHGKSVEDPAQFDVALWPERVALVKTRTQAIGRARAWLGD